MAGLTRKLSKLFGGSGTLSNFGQFGSKQAGLPQTSQDPTVIQQLSAWINGWSAAISGSDKAPYLQDMNGAFYVFSWFLTYLFQMGIPEWETGTLYFTGSVVQVAATGQQFQSLQGGVPGAGVGQSGNTPLTGASSPFWLWTNPPEAVIQGAYAANALPKVSGSSNNGPSGSKTFVASSVSDDGVNVTIAVPLIFPDGSVQSVAAAPAGQRYFATANVNVGGGSATFLVSGLTFHPALPGSLHPLPVVEVYPVQFGAVIRAGSADNPTWTSALHAGASGTNPIPGLFLDVALTDSFDLAANGYGSTADFMIVVTD